MLAITKNTLLNALQNVKMTITFLSLIEVPPQWVVIGRLGVVSTSSFSDTFNIQLNVPLGAVVFSKKVAK